MKYLVLLVLGLGSFNVLAEEDSCSHFREICRTRCLPKSCIQDGINCNQGRQACIQYCAEQFLETDCKSDNGAIQKPGRCQKLIGNYWPGGKIDYNNLKATCSSENDCLNLINDLILVCGASPVCPGEENKKNTPLEAATCALKDADHRLKVQKKGCGGYLCKAGEGFRGDSDFFISSLNVKEGPKGQKLAELAAQKNFQQICRANFSDPKDIEPCLSAAKVTTRCKYIFNIEGDGCLYEEEPESLAPAAAPRKKGSK